jgi:general secretion pathway protein L
MAESASAKTRSFRTFLQWWGAELRALLPRPLRRLLGLVRERWIVCLDDTHAEVLRRLDAGEPAVAIARLDLAAPDAVSQRVLAHLQRVPPPQLTLRLPAEAALRKTIALPEATLENLRGVLGFEMDRHTPFKAADVYFDCRVLNVDSALRQVQVELTAVPRAVADRALQRLRAVGLNPQAVDADGGAATDHELNLLHGGEPKPPPQLGPQWVESLLALTVVALLTAVVALPLYRTHRENAALQAQVDAARGEAEVVNVRVREAEILAAQSRFFDDHRRAAPTALAILDELSRITPDDTWLSQFSLSGRELTLRGESVAATRLIGVYENSPMYGNVRFRAQVTQNRLTNRERFDIAAEIVAPLREAP